MAEWFFKMKFNNKTIEEMVEIARMGSKCTEFGQLQNEKEKAAKLNRRNISNTSNQKRTRPAEREKKKAMQKPEL